MSNPIYLPSSSPEEWREFLADRGAWKPGFSAMELAYAWSGDGWPSAVSNALAGAGKELIGLEMLIGMPEHRVPLQGGSRASQTDLMIIARNQAKQLVVIAVEGKARETFGDQIVRDWRRKRPTGGREKRLRQLCAELGLPEPRAFDEPPDDALEALWYQLLHRTASAVIEAKRFNASHAIMLVHSFCSEDDVDGHVAFSAFASHLGLADAPARGEVREVPGREPALWLGWARSTLSAPSLTESPGGGGLPPVQRPQS